MVAKVKRGPKPRPTSALVRRAAREWSPVFLLRGLVQPRFGQLVKRWRGSLGYRDMARQCGVPSSTLDQIEAGRDCRASTMVRVLAWAVVNDRIDSEAEANSQLVPTDG